MKYLILLILVLSNTTYAKKTVDRIMAVVDNEIITLSDYNKFRSDIKKNQLVDDILFLNQNPKSVLKSKRKLLDALVSEKILKSEVKKKNLGINTKQVESEFSRIAKENGLTKKQLERELKRDGKNISEYKSFIKNRIERQRLIEQVISSRIKISNEEILQEYLKKNPKAKDQVFEYSLSHIFFSPRKKGGSRAAINRATAVLEKLRSGSNFESTAKKYSEDPNFSPGGFLGTAKAGEFNKSVARAISSLKVGESSKVVKTPAGYSILKINSKKMTENSHFSKVKRKIQRELAEKTFKKQFKLWLEEKRRLAFIRINK